MDDEGWMSEAVRAYRLGSDEPEAAFEAWCDVLQRLDHHAEVAAPVAFARKIDGLRMVVCANGTCIILDEGRTARRLSPLPDRGDGVTWAEDTLYIDGHEVRREVVPMPDLDQ